MSPTQMRETERRIQKTYDLPNHRNCNEFIWCVFPEQWANVLTGLVARAAGVAVDGDVQRKSKQHASRCGFGDVHVQISRCLMSLLHVILFLLHFSALDF